LSGSVKNDVTNNLKTLIFILFLFSFESQAQKIEYKGFPSLIWPKLYNVQYQKGKDKLGEFEKPLFPKEVLSLSGKEVTLPGYIVPFETGLKAKRFMLSSLPLNACFFCGVGGPETVVEVITKKEVSYTEKAVQISGILKLNDSDPDKMIYTLENAEMLGELEF
jgi:hypothetical protein